MAFFDSIKLLPDDPILSLPIAFAADQRPNKVNLGIGAYKDAEGKPLVLSSVKKAEAIIIEQKLNKEYLPIEGDPAFLKETLKLLMGKDHPLLESGLMFACQSVGGTSALRIGGELLCDNVSKNIYLSDPTWPNHKSIFLSIGMKLESYPYYNQIKNSLDFPTLCEYLENITTGGIVLLQAGCHNPTGIDPTFEEWKELSAIIKRQKLFPFFDLAYQGFGEGIDEDAHPIRYFAEQGHEMLIASSYSKNFGLYGERVGTLAVVANSKDAITRVSSQIKHIIRGIYSNPPIHGARIVTTILQNETLKQEWLKELGNMRQRIKEMRRTLVSGLMAKGSDRNFSFLNQQAGIFSFCGLNKDQVLQLRQEHGIYLPPNGRINVAGLNQLNLDYTIESIMAVLKQ